MDEVIFRPLYVEQSPEVARMNAEKMLQRVRLSSKADENPYDLNLTERELSVTDNYDPTARHALHLPKKKILRTARLEQPQITRIARKIGNEGILLKADELIAE
ncbi:hypothetical protein [Sporosarcina sp. JAI121]|uniref:hypothetical protein n=1 Tax=Sporosarcina sp. JAI121 TaxID=2723064 RepID=UPI0015C8919E|nr:hypothetical protein [Sporosarcina sp. JAI121]NYF23864.1 hypothetical protein [Sporosarcina sp. JAI121]